MKKNERMEAEKFLLQKISDGDPDFVDHTMEAYGVSRSTVYNYLTTLQNNGEVERVGGSTPYRVLYQTARFTVDPTRERSEDRMFGREVAPRLEGLPDNVQKIWRYAFTAMMNNALEHARASAIVCVVNRSRLCTIVSILDNGIGIFRRIQQHYKEEHGDVISTGEAASLLYAGGYTSDPENHAGQGIFFTAHLMDRFLIRSDSQFFTVHENVDDDEGGGSFRGTAVQMALSNDSPRVLGDVLNRYMDPEEGFVRTEIPIAQFFSEGFPVSRSEARRLGGIIADFREAELNFAGVEEIGPDFAHELFGVLAQQTPTLRLTVTNANPAVEALLRRAGYTPEA